MTKAIKAIEAAINNVPNRTDIIVPEVASYVDKYRHFAKQSAEAIINLALTLCEAEEKLSAVNFTLFCDQVSLEKKGSTYRKLKAIATNAARFMPVMDRLPNTWTTIYKLATIDAAQFDALVTNGAISPFMTMKEINDQLNIESPAKAGNDNKEADFTISVDGLSVEIKAAVYDMLYEIKSEIAIQIVTGKSVEEEVTAFRRSKAA